MTLEVPRYIQISKWGGGGRGAWTRFRELAAARSPPALLYPSSPPGFVPEGPPVGSRACCIHSNAIATPPATPAPTPAPMPRL